MLLFHAGNAVLVFLLIHRLLKRWNQPNPDPAAGRRTVCAALAAAVWALHPMRVEAAAWAVELNFVQSTFFFLLALLAYLRIAPPGEATGHNRFCWAAFLWFVVSLLSYPLALGGLLVFIVLDFYPLRRLDSNWRGWCRAPARRVWLEKAPFLLVILLVTCGSLYARIHASTAAWPKTPTLHEFGLFSRLMQAFYIWAYYLWKPWVPSHLCPVYTTLVRFDAGDWPFLLSAGLVLGLTFLLLWNRRRCPLALALWICYLALLVPVLGLTEHPHYPSDRYSYLPAILWSVLLAAILLKLVDHPKTFAGAAAGLLALIAILGAMSVRQTRIWRDSVSLFEYMLTTLGNDPYRAEIHWRLGQAYAGQQKLDEAVKQYRLSLAIEPRTPAHYPLAQALQAQGNLDEALDQYLAGLRRLPDAHAHAAVAEILMDRGRTREAIAHCREALRLEPALWPVLNNLAWILATDPAPANRDGKEAVQLAEQACRLTGQGVAGTVGTLAAAYAEAGRFREAIDAARRARALAKAAGDGRLADRNQMLLELYESGRPFHRANPPAKTSAGENPKEN